MPSGHKPPWRERNILQGARAAQLWPEFVEVAFALPSGSTNGPSSPHTALRPGVEEVVPLPSGSTKPPSRLQGLLCPPLRPGEAPVSQSQTWPQRLPRLIGRGPRAVAAAEGAASARRRMAVRTKERAGLRSMAFRTSGRGGSFGGRQWRDARRATPQASANASSLRQSVTERAKNRSSRGTGSRVNSPEGGR